MADPLNGEEGERYQRPASRADHARRLVRAASHHRLWVGMQRPWLTWGLLGVLIAVHLALGLRMLANGRTDLLGMLIVDRPEALLIRAGGQYAPAISRGQVWRLLSCVFLHGSGLHLFLNGLALAGLGRLCEALYGRRRLLFLFVVAGICGSTLSWLGGNRLSVGASGAIFGLLGAPIVFGLRHRDELPPPLSRWLVRSLPPWVVLNLGIGLLIPFIDNLAHVGGLLGGALLAVFMGNRVVPGRQGPGWTQALMVGASVVALGLAAWGVAGRWR